MLSVSIGVEQGALVRHEGGTFCTIHSFGYRGNHEFSYSPTRTCVRFELREMLGRITLLESEKKWGFEILQAFSLSSRIPPPPSGTCLQIPLLEQSKTCSRHARPKLWRSGVPLGIFLRSQGGRFWRLVEQFHRSLLENEVLAL